MVAFDEKALNDIVLKKVRQTPKGMVDRMLKKVQEARAPKKELDGKR